MIKKNKTCFVIMGYGVKNNIDLDETYKKIIKPVIEEKKLKPYPLYKNDEFNAFRCDEIQGTIAIDFKYVTCLSNSDIVIADISTMNINAIYELGARHALRKKTTILLCAKEKEKNFRFFDLSYVPIIFYNYERETLDSAEIARTKSELSKAIEFAIFEDIGIPDNPIQRALVELEKYGVNFEYENVKESIYEMYTTAQKYLDDMNFVDASAAFKTLYQRDPSVENLMKLTLAQYKIEEENKSEKGLYDLINLIESELDIDNIHSERVFGRIAAIYLRLYKLTKNKEYFYNSLHFYRKGSECSQINLYCPRNYCALLLKVHEITDNLEQIKEFYYTALYSARNFIKLAEKIPSSKDYEKKVYLESNLSDLKAIVDKKYTNYETLKNSVMNNKDISKRQQKTILDGIFEFNNDLESTLRLIS